MVYLEQFTIRLEKEDCTDLETQAKRKGVPKAVFARMLIKERLEQILGGNHAIAST